MGTCGGSAPEPCSPTKSGPICSEVRLHPFPQCRKFSAFKLCEMSPMSMWKHFSSGLFVALTESWVGNPTKSLVVNIGKFVDTVW